MRKLVTIRTISNLEPIPGADVIEKATIGLWSVVVKKGAFSIGSECLFFEIDSILPASDERFAFLGTPKLFNNISGHRLRTIRLRKQLSQGLALPLSSFPEIVSGSDDYAEQLSVIKYERPVRNSGTSGGNARGAFPDFLRKTDQERIQNLPDYFTTHHETEYEETLKLDGSSMTAYKVARAPTMLEAVANFFCKLVGRTPTVPYTFGVCSRNIDLTRSESNVFWQLAIENNLEKLLPVGYAVQGEALAPNIQSNWEKVSKPEFRIFDVFSIHNQIYLPPAARHDFLAAHMPSILHVPVVSYRTAIFTECPTFDELQTRVTGPSFNPSTISEGRVYKAVDGSHSFKCISNAYLLKGGN